jgi:hypothetical protein
LTALPCSAAFAYAATLTQCLALFIA